MKLILMSLIFLACSDMLSAQPISIAWKGQREIVEIKDKENRVISLSEPSEACGEYFTYREIKDQKVLSFKIQLIKTDKKVSPYQHIDFRILKIKLNEKINTPTVEYLSSSNKSEYPKPIFKIRISKDDLKEANCLSEFLVKQSK
jgi:hypothetical protein